MGLLASMFMPRQRQTTKKIALFCGNHCIQSQTIGFAVFKILWLSFRYDDTTNNLAVPKTAIWYGAPLSCLKTAHQSAC